ncbi:hypothetical protein [Puniceicoccus vermicola]|uniref:Uncharacterized protein n=1 Tax=Puniceicoccus vermicola TaxID=388746 RepID=A0A7X1AWC8_9BACT|nr:hypothetical protein [Puniceicoccus vermicola]MBC2600999.1 hypothetical protein [Puniceicoccus vermicola]
MKSIFFRFNKVLVLFAAVKFSSFFYPGEMTCYASKSLDYDRSNRSNEETDFVHIAPISWESLSTEKSIDIIDVLVDEKDFTVINDFYLFMVFSEKYKKVFDPVLNKKISLSFSGGSFNDLIQNFKNSTNSSVSVAWSDRKISFFPTGYSDQQILLRSILFEVEEKKEVSGVPVGFLFELMNRRCKEKRFEIRIRLESDDPERLKESLLETSELMVGDTVTVVDCLSMLKYQFSLEVDLSEDGDIWLRDTGKK